tara:strand:- start:15273 stop:15374 length:102 start_codon:yes stop_codon:yes gene_type:complete
MKEGRQMTLYEFGLKMKGQTSLLDYGLKLDEEE